MKRTTVIVSIAA